MKVTCLILNRLSGKPNKLSCKNTVVYAIKYKKMAIFSTSFVNFCNRQASNPVVVLVTLVTLSQKISVTVRIQCPCGFSAFKKALGYANFFAA